MDDEFGDEPEIETDTAPEAAAPVYLTEQENSEALDAVRRVAEEFRLPELSIWVAGSPVVTCFLKQSMMKDIRNFLVMATVTLNLE